MTTLSAPDRLLAVLAAFDHQHPALSLTGISRRAGLTLTTAHRLVGALTDWGALERDADGVYHVGLRLWEIAALAPRGLALRQVALPYLEDLYEATHENVQMAVRDGAEVVYIEWISGRSAVGVRIQVGARWPLHATGVGLALLAHSDSAFQEAYCSVPLAAFTPHTLTDGARLRRALAEVRRTGVAVSSRQVTDDALSVAAPVRGAAGRGGRGGLRRGPRTRRPGTGVDSGGTAGGAGDLPRPGVAAADPARAGHLRLPGAHFRTPFLQADSQVLFT